MLKQVLAGLKIHSDVFQHIFLRYQPTDWPIYCIIQWSISITGGRMSLPSAPSLQLVNNTCKWHISRCDISTVWFLVAVAVLLAAVLMAALTGPDRHSHTQCTPVGEWFKPTVKHV